MATAERVERRMMLVDVDVDVEMRNVDVFVGQRKGRQSVNDCRRLYVQKSSRMTKRIINVRSKV